MERWMLQTKRGDFYGLAEQFGLSPVTVRLMVNRGVSTPEQIWKYLYGGRQDEYSPYLLLGAEEAADRLLAAVRRGEKILIASDYDVDGIFSGQILLEALRRVGGDCAVCTPHRVKEGYGVNPGMVERAKRDGFSVLLTSDNGIAAFEAVERAKKLGMEVIVTDHHECQWDESRETLRLPAADVVVDPHQPGENYPFPGLCGAGVVYKFVEILYEKCGLPQTESDRFLEYLAVATVADVMELKDENRIFVKEGLRRLEHTENAGLAALIEVCGLKGKRLTAYHIGFILGPCFNSAGRLGTAQQAFDLLAAGPGEAAALAQSLKELNDSRKQMTNRGVEEACAWVERQERRDDIFVIPLPDCHESIAGIVAGKVREQYHHPTIVVTPAEHGWKGSGRSTESWNMFQGLSDCRDLMTHFGGHPMAAGFSLPEENIESLRRRLNADTGLTPEDFIPEVKIDVALPLGYLSESFVEELDLLEPCGTGNPEPLFAESRFALRRGRVVGKNLNVLRLTVENTAGTRMEAVYFGDIPAFEELVRENFGPEALGQLYRGEPNPIALSLAYYPQIDEYRGVRSLQIVISYLRAAPDP